jgi:hypothetical protein
VPGALDHASGDVDEFDAALVRGAAGAPAQPDALDGADVASVPDVEDDTVQLDEREVEAEALSEGDLSADELEEPADSIARVAPGGGRSGGVSPVRQSAVAIARSRSCAPAGPSCSVCSGPTVSRSSKPQLSSWASWRSPAPTSAWPTMWQRKSSNSSSDVR